MGVCVVDDDVRTIPGFNLVLPNRARRNLAVGRILSVIIVVKAVRSKFLE